MCNAAIGGPEAGAAAFSQPDAPQPDATENTILDAAGECVLAFGVRRTSLSDVARRAGVSRPTVYRRWPDRQALVADLMTRELAAVFATAAGHEPDRSGEVRAQAVGQFLAAAAGLRAHPLLTKIIEVDPELLQPYIFDRLGASQRMALGFVTNRIRAGQRDGSVRAGDVTAMSATVLLSIQSLVLSARTVTGLLTPGQLDAEAAVLLDRYLSPGRQEGPA
ncbi:MAG TPA: TetR/AcrR family transcriptional regulator [Streptosporangiaceae bacterium]|jgi:AcrR family transcriptional regulator